jgi:hypothetical protein
LIDFIDFFNVKNVTDYFSYSSTFLHCFRPVSSKVHGNHWELGALGAEQVPDEAEGAGPALEQGERRVGGAGRLLEN